MFYNQRKQQENKLTKPLDTYIWRKLVLDQGNVSSYGVDGIGEYYYYSKEPKDIPFKEIILEFDWEREYCLPEHPLVDSGEGYWKNKATLIIGYELKSDPKIYLPIFQYKKEILNFKLRNEIRRYAKFIVSDFRQSLYKRTLMDIPELYILSEDIIDKIAHLTYDPLSYLKL